MTVNFHPMAELEMRNAMAWYERQRTGLSSEFLLSIDEAIERVLRNPRALPIVHHQVRRALIRRFPFGLFFEIHEDEIRVLAIFHSRRDPSHWKTRT